jgi:hypothetical protein
MVICRTLAIETSYGDKNTKTNFFHDNNRVIRLLELFMTEDIPVVVMKKMVFWFRASKIPKKVAYRVILRYPVFRTHEYTPGSIPT